VKFVLHTVILFVTLQSWSQEPISDPNQVKSVFWKITDPESQKVSYLFGTMHMVSKSKFLLPKEVKMKLYRSDALFLELVDFESTTGINEMMVNDKRLSEDLNKEQRDSLYTFTKKELGLDSAQFEDSFGKMSPFMFSMLLYKDIMLNSESYDMTLFELAKEKGIPSEGLETSKQQMDFLTEMDTQTRVETIMSTVRYGFLFKTMFSQMEDAYLEQDIAMIKKHDLASEKVNEFMENNLLVQRNIEWMSILGPRMKKQNLFIGVGAAHLFGDEGLLLLLMDAGFLVEPVNIRLIK
jgi:uncharacterized protein